MTVIETVPWYAWIPIVAIVCGTVSGIAKMILTHNERLAMIRQGMHPDVHGGKPHEASEI